MGRSKLKDPCSDHCCISESSDLHSNKAIPTILAKMAVSLIAKLILSKNVFLQFFFNEGKLIIRNGTVVNADRKFEADVYIEDGIIK